MKHITHLFSLLLFVCTAYFVQAQNIQTTPASNSGVCDGAAYLLDSNVYQSWTWIDINQQTLQTGGTSVSGLCPGVNYFQYIDSNGTNTYTFYIDTLINSGCEGFGAIVSSSPVSAFGQCDATATANIYGGTMPYSYVWPNGTTTQTTSGLCAGDNYFYASDANGCIYTAAFYVYGDSTNTDTTACTGFGIQTIDFVQPSSPFDCDGFIEVAAYGGDDNYTYTWQNMFLSGNSASNLCADTYTITAADGNGCTASVSLTLYGDSVDCSGFSAYLANFSQISSPNTCDGMAQIGISGGSGQYEVIWDNGMSGAFVSGFCPGYYVATIYDNGTGCSTSTNVYFYADSMYYNLDGYVYPYSPSAEGLCDGSAYVDVYGGTAPYTFLHSDGSTDQYAANLCSGIYSVTVTDANGDSLFINYIVPEPSNIFNGGIYDDTIVVDTIYNDLIEDCLIDYLTLDTAFISGIEYAGMDSLIVTWSVIDGNGTIEFLQSYSISTGVGVYELILQIFCPQRSGSPYVYSIDQVYFNPGAASVEEIAGVSKVSVYPNPVQDVLTVQLDEALPSVITIHDITGKIVHQELSGEKEIQLNISLLAKGQYTLHVANEKTNLTRLIIK
ncbi:MAG: T9SS type A sorting domain-containing protein [Bacteroidota bacterium]